MIASVHLRTVTPDDEQLLFEVYASSRTPEMASLPWSEEQKSAFLRFQFEAQHRHYNQHFSNADQWVVEADGEPVGRLWIHDRAGEIRILDIALLSEKRGQGIGTYLLENLLDRAQSESKPVRINIENYQRSASLFERLGFSVIDDDGVNQLMEWRPETEDGVITLRDVREDDAPFLFQLYCELREPELHAVGLKDEERGSLLEMQFRVQASGYEAQFAEAQHQIVEFGGKPIGRILVDRSGSPITLVDINFLPAARGRGIGTRLLRDLLDEAAAEAASVRLKVALGNPARRLYSRLGFESLGDDGVYEQLEWRPTL